MSIFPALFPLAFRFYHPRARLRASVCASALASVRVGGRVSVCVRVCLWFSSLRVIKHSCVLGAHLSAREFIGTACGECTNGFISPRQCVLLSSGHAPQCQRFLRLRRLNQGICICVKISCSDICLSHHFLILLSLHGYVIRPSKEAPTAGTEQIDFRYPLSNNFFANTIH